MDQRLTESMHEDATKSISSYQQICPSLVLLANRSDDDSDDDDADDDGGDDVVVAVFVERNLRMLQKSKGRDSCAVRA